MWEMHDGSGWWMVFASIWMLLFWGAIIVGVAWLIAHFNARPGVQDAALEIVRQRYARGDITHDEFQRLVQELKN
jgi:putative membrane protein